MMRRFDDGEGRPWDVIVGKASWGALYALFVPAGGRDEPVRQAPLRASSQEDAAAELEAMDARALAAMLERSTLKDS